MIEWPTLADKRRSSKPDDGDGRNHGDDAVIFAAETNQINPRNSDGGGGYWFRLRSDCT